MYMQAEHFLGDDFYTVGGYYEDDLIRTAGGWKLTGVKLNVLWERGDKRVMEISRLANEG